MLSFSAMAADFNQMQRWANQGIAEAQFNLGLIYDNGEGVRQDYSKAAQWYEKAANQGIAEAQFNLGLKYNNGEGVRQDKATAKELFSKACYNGYQEGCDRNLN